MGAYLGIAAPPAASHNERAGAGKEKAAKKQAGAAFERTETGVTGITGATELTQTGDQPAVTPAESDVDESIFNFGLEDDGVEYVDWAGPQRIKQSRVTDADRAKFRGHLDLIFSKQTILGTRIAFDPDDVVEVMQKVMPYLESEPVLIEDVPFGVTIVGDLYGQLYDLNRVFHGHSKDGKPGWECQKFVFLGDYVDRGHQSLEVVMALFCIKMLYPDNIFLLRGHHEFALSNFKDGFMEELDERYAEDIAIILFLQINETFCYLSIAAIVGDSYFCAHGGISPARFTRRQLRAIRKPIQRSTDDVLIHDIVWSDPARGLPGTTFNVKRRTSMVYGFDAVAKALISMEVKAIFRGHTRVKEGYENFWDVVYTIFTATDNCYTGNKGSVAIIDEHGKLTLNILEVNIRRTKLQIALDDQAGKPKVNVVDRPPKIRSKSAAKAAAKAKDSK